MTVTKNRPALFPKAFMKASFAIALPIALQSFLTSAVNMIDVVMLGHLGDVDIAAVGCANQIYFLLTLILFGVSSGASVFMAQFWGKGDKSGVHRTMGIMYLLALGISVLFTAGTLFFPELLISIYSDDPLVIKAGVPYLRIVGSSYIVTALSLTLSNACRSTGNVKLPTFTSILSMVTNMLLNLILIFGYLGFPAMGLKGAAIATAIARYAEFIVLAAVVYKKRMPAAATIKQLFSRLDGAFLRPYFKTTLPVLLNEALWSLGVSLYTVAYGKLGTGALAAAQICGTVFQLFMVLIRGYSNASAIMIGQTIGSGDEEGALRDGNRFLVLHGLLGAATCALLYLCRPVIVTFFTVTPETRQLVMEMMALQAVILIPKSINMVVIVGLCRSGGDTLFACILDTVTVWAVAVPLAFLGVYLGFPLWGVYLCVGSEEISKAIVGIPRILSKKWLHNVVENIG